MSLSQVNVFGKKSPAKAFGRYWGTNAKKWKAPRSLQLTRQKSGPKENSSSGHWTEHGIGWGPLAEGVRRRGTFLLPLFLRPCTPRRLLAAVCQVVVKKIWCGSRGGCQPGGSEVQVTSRAGQAGGGSFNKEKKYIAKKEFAHRMCARRPTSAMPKPFLCCERAFCCSMVVMRPVLMSWSSSCLRGEMKSCGELPWGGWFMSCHVIWCGGHVTWCDVIACVASRPLMQCDVMWRALMWWAVICCALQWDGMSWGHIVWFSGSVVIQSTFLHYKVLYNVLFQYNSVRPQGWKDVMCFSKLPVLRMPLYHIFLVLQAWFGSSKPFVRLRPKIWVQQSTLWSASSGYQSLSDGRSSMCRSHPSQQKVVWPLGSRW